MWLFDCYGGACEKPVPYSVFVLYRAFRNDELSGVLRIKQIEDFCRQLAVHEGRHPRPLKVRVFSDVDFVPADVLLADADVPFVPAVCVFGDDCEHPGFDAQLVDTLDVEREPPGVAIYADRPMEDSARLVFWCVNFEVHVVINLSRRTASALLRLFCRIRC